MRTPSGEVSFDRFKFFRLVEGKENAFLAFNLFHAFSAVYK